VTVRRLRADETTFLKTLRLRALADAVLAWARERGFGDVVLWVAEGNAAAAALYERAGFTRTGRRDHLASNPSLSTCEMDRPL